MDSESQERGCQVSPLVLFHFPFHFSFDHMIAHVADRLPVWFDSPLKTVDPPKGNELGQKKMLVLSAQGL